MKVECTIDSKQHILNVNSNKPLNRILFEDIEPALMIDNCDAGNCGNCVVLLNDKAALACLIPAFKLRGAKVMTFRGYQKSRFWHDVERAYEDTGSNPCPYCYASKSLIFESLLQTVAKPGQSESEVEQLSEQTIIDEISLNRCPCLNHDEIIEIFNQGAMYRRRRRVRRY